MYSIDRFYLKESFEDVALQMIDVCLRDTNTIMIICLFADGTVKIIDKDGVRK